MLGVKLRDRVLTSQAKSGYREFVLLHCSNGVLALNFSEFKLRRELAENLAQIGFQTPTSIQEAVVPLVVDGKDVSGLSQTGTGKTAAFVLPLMERVLCSYCLQAGKLADLPEEDRPLVQQRAFTDWKKHQFVMILVPTRELAEQVYQDIYKLRGTTGLEAVSIYGGTSYDTQKSKIDKGVEFVVGTPGRVIDLFKSHVLDLKQVRAIVFDEADRMFDMGFRDDMKYILQRVPKDRQFLVFSATLNFEVLHTAYQFGADPIEFNVSKDQPKAENVKDFICHIAQEEKPGFLLTVLKKYNPKQTIVFVNYKHSVERAAQFLTQNGFPALAISSLLTQSQRNRVIDQFKSENEKNIMVATDLAARGLDIKGVDLVINFDLPEDAENYVHRIGRTGRAGALGTAVSLVSDRDVESLMRVEEYLKNKVEVLWFDEAEIIRKFKPMSSGDRRPNFSPPPTGERFGNGRSGRAPQGRREQHRDRRTGRHSGLRDTKPQHEPRRETRNAQPARPARPPTPNSSSRPASRDRSGQSFRSSNEPRRKHEVRRSSSPRRAPPTSTGVVSKIKALFKRIAGK